MQLTVTQLYAVSRALSVAADVYQDDANNLRAKQPRLAEQFEQQAHEARTLADKIDSEL